MTLLMAKSKVKNQKLSPTKILQNTLNSVINNGSISDEEAERIMTFFEVQSLEKNEVFTQRGQVCKKLGILTKGLLSASYETPKKVDQVSRFMFLPHHFIVSDFESFTKGTPATESIIAIEKSEMLVINYKDMVALYNALPKMNMIGREVAEDFYIKALHRIYDLQVLNAEERVSKFFKNYPDLYNRVGKQEIASYLRMNRNLVTKYFKP